MKQVRNTILLAIAACALTGCPEGALSEGVTDEPCDNRFYGTQWATDCGGERLTLTFTSCEIWEAAIGQETLHGYYVGRNDTVTGGMAGQPADSVCCLTQSKTFSGLLNADGQLVVGDCAFARQN